MKLDDIDTIRPCPKPSQGPRVVRLLIDLMRFRHDPRLPEPVAEARLAIARRWLRGDDTKPFLELAESQLRAGRKGDRLAKRADKLQKRAERFDARHQRLGEQLEQMLAEIVIGGVADVFSGQQCPRCGWHLRARNDGICPVCPAEEGAP